ncbi:5629_t:CDS:1, partial [Scutellospora calospora]
MLTKLDLSLENNALRKALYGEDPEEKMHRRKMHLRGLTNKKQYADICKIA